ncbi:AAA family ATPase [Exiguobacterium sp. FSL W8-0210]|uniref:DEAD/DEAH box helicase n=1 Tax=Exiguobacterium sp. FSL W8-0210 TaxID=2921598 RepID=UPI0030F55270
MIRNSSFFYKNLDKSNSEVDIFINRINKYSVENQFQIYVLDKPVMEKETDYDTSNIMILLSPSHTISLISLNNNKDTDEVEEIFEYLIQDIGFTAKKFKYNSVIGRSNRWEKYFKKYNFSEIQNIDTTEKISHFFDSKKYIQPEEKRVIDLIISLITGSINDIDAVGKTVPETLLQKIRQKIVLFDGDQTRFIYEELNQDIVKIQGLAGTGKTELLLHRLKELYTENDTNKIAFTCHNITLANKLKSRVPEFFDFMKVDEQIKWNERLWVFHGWGSLNNKNNLGLYGLICNIYGLPFFNVKDVREGKFQRACQQSLSFLKEMIENGEEINPYFDYILIDEAQDFPDEFIELCKMVTSKTVYLAGDIFQDIFEMQELASEPDFSLNKVYRTHPKNLMFAHAVGMGLFENPTINWLEKSGWDACGYLVNNNGRNYNLTREKVLRFQEMDMDGLECTKIIPTTDILESILNVIKEIVEIHNDVIPDDIAIIFTNNKLSQNDYDFITYVQARIFENFNWNSSVTYKDKRVEKGKITISNKNNIKGLEFPFVICVANHQITRNFAERNTFYMSLTRSFLTSYLVVQEINNLEIIDIFKTGLETIQNTDAINTIEPTENEKALQRRLLREIKQPKKSQYEVLHEIFEKLNLEFNDQNRIQAAISMLNTPTTKYETLENLVKSMLEA